ncbi:hypothetical protein BO71DRAFT_408896 [Aspergillus ellipticus CBS 707.79]|uniref:S-adenosyl-L-methionine-dependent methyltransferase n=1 Tax=Aspergillus ellipticus CBS 707.79 TaxID=1448320 RepID=A0A319DCH5_9EURO|nr:hypothetical protein BO71DRAFT_408896 [Aspergillus ellipticus CBS 707.79]
MSAAEEGGNEHAPKREWIMHRLSLSSNSGPGSDPGSDQISITSNNSYEARSITAVVENGRRYCNDTYFMPNDEPEQTRLNIIHQIYLVLLDGHLTAAPIALDAPRTRILDIGTGPGDWAIEMSTTYPTSPSPHRTSASSTTLDDARDEWTYADGPFDLIHLRGLAGGHVEVANIDFSADTMISTPADSYLRLFSSVLRSAADSIRYPCGMSHLRSAVLDAEGFVDVHVRAYTFPIGLWAEPPRERTLGKMALVALLEGLEAFSLRLLTAKCGWMAEEVRDLCDQVKTELLGGQPSSDCAGLHCHGQEAPGSVTGGIGKTDADFSEWLNAARPKIGAHK